MKKVKRLLSIVLTVFMLWSFMMVGLPGVSATSITADQAISWCQSNLGKGVEYGVDAYRYQCVDFIQAYYAYLGVTPSTGSGYQYATNTVPSGWTRTKGGTPQKGDILVYTGGYGHVAIHESNNVSYHQNWSGSYVEKVSRAYNKSFYVSSEGVTKIYWGCIHPNFASTHTHNYNTFVEYQSAHPHYAVYKCSCGATQVNKGVTQYSSTCSSCTSGLGGTQTLADGDYYISSALNNNKVIDIDNNKINNKGANAQLWDYAENSTNQIFTVKYLGSGFYSIICKKSAQSLDVADASTKEGTNVWQYSVNNSNAQQWVIKSAGNGYFYIISKCNGLYLDAYNGATANGTNIHMWHGNSSNAQKWKFNFAYKQNLGSSFYATITRTSDGMAFTDTNRNLALYSNKQSQNQIWRFNRQGDGSYMIYNIATGNYIDLAVSKTENGANIKTYIKHDVNAQHWYIVKNGSSYTFYSKCDSSFVIDAASNAKYEGTNLQLYKSNNSAAQKYGINMCNCLSFQTNGGSLHYDNVLNFKANSTNDGRGDSQCVVYTSGFGTTTNTNKYGKEISFDSNGKYVGFRDYGSDTNLKIPIGGFVISEHWGSNAKKYINQIKDVYKYAYVIYETNTVVLFKTEKDYKNGTRRFATSGKRYSTLPVPLRNGYNFDGWYTSINGGTKITESSVYNGISTIYAHWTPIPKTNPITVEAAAKSVKYATVKKKNVTVTALTVKDAQGSVSYKKLSGNKKITVNSQNGKLTVKKGLGKGTYSIKVNVTAQGNSNYKSANKTISVKIKVK